ncbi:MAG: Hsp70 family protein, partial [Myxococcaceae bacterium]
RSDVPIEVTFELSGEGLLGVRAVNLTTGVAEAVQVQARTELSQNELKKLATEQQAYASEQSGKDVEQLHTNFGRLLEKAERIAGVLEVSARENPGPEAQAAVANVRALIDSGRAALKVKDTGTMADVTRRLTGVLTGQTA